MLLVDADGRLGYVNTAGCATFALAPDVAAARPLLVEAIPNPDLADLLAPRSCGQLAWRATSAGYAVWPGR